MDNPSPLAGGGASEHIRVRASVNVCAPRLGWRVEWEADVRVGVWVMGAGGRSHLLLDLKVGVPNLYRFREPPASADCAVVRRVVGALLEDVDDPGIVHGLGATPEDAHGEMLVRSGSLCFRRRSAGVPQWLQLSSYGGFAVGVGQDVEELFGDVAVFGALADRHAQDSLDIFD
jgi:hypothetical protein